MCVGKGRYMYGSRGLMDDDGSEYDFHVYTSLKSGMVRVWSGARAGRNIITFKVNESSVLHMHYDDDNSWLIVVL